MKRTIFLAPLALLIAPMMAVAQTHVSPNEDQAAAITAPWTMTEVNSIIYVDGVTYSLSDVGAGINAAYAACPTSSAIGGSSCRIIVPPNPTGACRTLTTPVVLTTSGKLVDIDLSGSCINDPSTTSHDSFLLDYMPSSGTLSFVPQHGIHNGTLINNGCSTNGGCGSSATAIANGTTNYGAQLGDFSHLKIEGYGTSFVDANTSAWGESFTKNTFTHNTIAVSLAATLEQMKFYDDAFLSNSYDLDVTGQAEAAFYGGHLDQATVCSVNTHAATALLDFQGMHFENLNLSGSPCYTEGTASTIKIEGGVAYDDHIPGAAATSWFTGAFFMVRDLALYTGGRITNPNYLFSVGNQADIDVYIGSPGTLDADHIIFAGTGVCSRVMQAGKTPFFKCGGDVTSQSSAYTLTSYDHWVNVTGTTTISVDPTLTGERWVVFDADPSLTTTLKTLSGTINGVAGSTGIPITSNTGKEVSCNGTNCFAH